MIQKVNIKTIWVDTVLTEYGSYKTNFKCTQYGDKWITGFAKPDVAQKLKTDWASKNELELELDIITSDKLGKDGKPYINWKFPNKESTINDRIAKLEFSIANIHRKIDEIVRHIKMAEDPTKGITSAGIPVPNFTPNTPEQEADYVKKMTGYDALTDRIEPTEEEINAMLNT